MTADLPNWLMGSTALIVGDCATGADIAGKLKAAGAKVEHAGHVASVDAAAEALHALTGDGLTADLLVHLEPEFEPRSAEEMSPEEWRSALGSALDSGFFYASAFARQQFRLGTPGDILMVVRPDNMPGRSAAAAARGGIRNLVQTLAVEWARDGLRVNAIESGLMDGGNTEEVRALTSLCAYLLSDFASYVTGAVLGVNDVHACTL